MFPPRKNLVLPAGCGSTSAGWFSRFFYCTVSAIVTCLLIGFDPDVVAVTMTVELPVGVPGFEVVQPPLLLVLPEHAVHPMRETVSAATTTRNRAFSTICFLLSDRTPMSPGSNSAYIHPLPCPDTLACCAQVEAAIV